jgi:lysophospholipase L1-like esterase
MDGDGFLLRDGDTIVVIGDSITYSGGYVRVMHELLDELQLKVHIVNAGKSGQKAEQLAERFNVDVVQRRPRWCIVSVGINDVWHRLHAPHDEKVLRVYKENVSRMVTEAQMVGIGVILCTPTVIEEEPESEANQRLLFYCAAIRDVASEQNCLVADLHVLILQAIRAKPADAQRHFFTFDGVHMNRPGNLIMAEGILSALGVPREKIRSLWNEKP